MTVKLCVCKVFHVSFRSMRFYYFLGGALFSWLSYLVFLQHLRIWSCWQTLLLLTFLISISAFRFIVVIFSLLGSSQHSGRIEVFFAYPTSVLLSLITSHFLHFTILLSFICLTSISSTHEWQKDLLHITFMTFPLPTCFHHNTFIILLTLTRPNSLVYLSFCVQTDTNGTY